MGIEDAEHAGNSALVDGFVDVHRLGVVGLDDVKCLGEIADGILVIVRGGGGGLDVRAVDAAKNGGEKENGNDEHQPAAFRFHAHLARKSMR